MFACAPPIDAPADKARIADSEDAARLAIQLRSLPGTTAAEVLLRRPVPDPFTNTTPPPYASAAIIVDDPLYRTTAIAAATRLVRAAVPEVAHPEIVVEVEERRPAIERVGPFRVEVTTKPRLMATLLAGLLLIGTLAGYIAWKMRPAR